MALENMDRMPKTISWIRKRPQNQEYEHMNSTFEKNGVQPADYIIAPDWVSEEGDPTVPFQARRYRPWAYEFQGARYFPWGTMERKVVATPRTLSGPEPGNESKVENNDTAEAAKPCGDHSAAWENSNHKSLESYTKPSRIPPPFPTLMQPRRVSDNKNGPYVKISTSASYPSMSVEEREHMAERGFLGAYPPNLSTDGGFYRAKHTDDPLDKRCTTGTEVHYPETYTHHEREKKAGLSTMMPGSKITKLPYLNFSNAQWLTTFNVDKYNL